MLSAEFPLAQLKNHVNEEIPSKMMTHQLTLRKMLRINPSRPARLLMSVVNMSVFIYQLRLSFEITFLSHFEKYFIFYCFRERCLRNYAQPFFAGPVKHQQVGSVAVR